MSKLDEARRMREARYREPLVRTIAASVARAIEATAEVADPPVVPAGATAKERTRARQAKWRAANAEKNRARAKAGRAKAKKPK